MTIQMLREFVMLAEIGNYAAAAEPLFISEATLSRHIIALEKEIGTPLFIRYPRHIELTEAGFILIPYARKIIEEENTCHAKIKRAQSQSRVTVSIGCDGILASYGVMEQIARFQALHPEYQISITEFSSFTLKEKVSNGELPFAFIVDDGTQSNSFHTLPYTEDTLAAVFSHDHPLASHDSIHLSKLSEENLLLPPPFTIMYELYSKVFHDSGFTPFSTVSANPVGALAGQMIHANLCVGIMPIQIAMHHSADLYIREILPQHSIKTAVIYNPDTLDKGSALFLEFMKGAFADENGTV